MVRSEYFASGTIPNEYCDHHISATICKDSNMPVTEFCPEASRETKIFITDGSANTTDGEYLLTDEVAQSTCNIHTEAEKPDKDKDKNNNKDKDKDKDKDKNNNKDKDKNNNDKDNGKDNNNTNNENENTNNDSSNPNDDTTSSDNSSEDVDIGVTDDTTEE